MLALWCDLLANGFENAAPGNESTSAILARQARDRLGRHVEQLGQCASGDLVGDRATTLQHAASTSEQKAGTYHARQI
jgi:hypothetical protein